MNGKLVVMNDNRVREVKKKTKKKIKTFMLSKVIFDKRIIWDYAVGKTRK